ncbi:MAG: hypothetical protein ACTS42_00330 [Candidatus Hodgkinia cicadicola]
MPSDLIVNYNFLNFASAVKQLIRTALALINLNISNRKAFNTSGGR